MTVSDPEIEQLLQQRIEEICLAVEKGTPTTQIQAQVRVHVYAYIRVCGCVCAVSLCQRLVACTLKGLRGSTSFSQVYLSFYEKSNRQQSKTWFAAARLGDDRRYWEQW